MDRVDAIVIGAGVVGLACARALALRGIETVVLEKNSTFGQGVSSRSSEVIHAGIYYQPNSLKTRLCVEGRHQLYSYCEKRNIPHRRTGKFVVATEKSQLMKLEALHGQAVANDIKNTRLLTGSEAQASEPELHCLAALSSPSTGILDSHQLMLSLLGDAEHAGATIAFRTTVSRGVWTGNQWEIQTNSDGSAALAASILINAAGLDAQQVAANLKCFPTPAIPQIHFAKGNYFSLQGRCPFSTLIYPLPPVGGLGIHLTLDLEGRGRFGPDVEWCKEADYRVDIDRAMVFTQSIRRFWPGISVERLSPDYAGIRPKLHGPDAAFADFVIQGPTDHSLPGLVHLFGIESPGLTSCFAIADHVLHCLGLGTTETIH